MLPELEEIERLAGEARPWVRFEVAGEATARRGVFPLYALTLGNPDPGVPGIGYFGGIHGVERIGAQVVLAFLSSLVARLRWDQSLPYLLQRVRVLLMPVVNPAGMAAGTRANGRGVDLMRNAPVECADPVPPLVGGHRLGPWLPWYRGRAGQPMEPESEVLCHLVRRELLGRPFSVALDCHSGFGTRDRLWFPYAHRRSPMESLPEMHALHEVFVRTHPHHAYVIEPQSNAYLTHGDLWDHMVIKAAAQGAGVFLPLTLEMGSWIWVKKNPRQLLARGGIFNPLIAHREHRALRRHLPLLDFLLRAVAGYAQWLPPATQREEHRAQALARWYRGPNR